MEEEDNNKRAPTREVTASSGKQKVVFDYNNNNDDPLTPDDTLGLKISLTSDAPTSSERSFSLAVTKNGMGINNHTLSESQRVLED